jgi:hypothetical protein
VRDDIVELEYALLDPGEQLVNVALGRALTKAHFDAFVENLAAGEIVVRHAIGTSDRPSAAAAHGADGVAKRLDTAAEPPGQVRIQNPLDPGIGGSSGSGLPGEDGCFRRHRRRGNAGAGW